MVCVSSHHKLPRYVLYSGYLQDASLLLNHCVVEHADTVDHTGLNNL